MSLLSGNKKDAKKGGKGAKNALSTGTKQSIKPGGKAAAFSKKPMKTGGTRGS